MCSVMLDHLWQCDHVREWADGGVTQTYNAHALCGACHRKKTNEERIKRITGMAG
jgi:5-methylcytosine-specific restriction endonuclease McrA